VLILVNSFFRVPNQSPLLFIGGLSQTSLAIAHRLLTSCSLLTSVAGVKRLAASVCEQSGVREGRPMDGVGSMVGRISGKGTRKKYIQQNLSGKIKNRNQSVSAT